MAPITIDWQALATEVGQNFLAEFSKLVSATEEDLKAFAGTIAHRLVTAVKIGDASWQTEIMAQIKGLAEVLRIRVTVVAWDTLAYAVKITFQALLAAAKVALGSIK